MDRIIDFQATEPVRKVDEIRPIIIPQSPRKLVLATIRITIPRRNANKNLVELIATVGVRGIKGTSQLLFKIFRDGQEIFRAQEGVEADPESEVNYVVTFQAIDRNVRAGTHRYQVTVENITKGTEAAVVGPISFSGLAIDTSERDGVRTTGRDGHRTTGRDQNRTTGRNSHRTTRRDQNRTTEMNRHRTTRREQNLTTRRNQHLTTRRNQHLTTRRNPQRTTGREQNQNVTTGRNRVQTTNRNRNRNWDWIF